MEENIFSGVDMSVHKPQEVTAKIKSLHVKSDIRYRYAKTLVTSTVLNTADKAEEIFFHIILPESAFISEFEMKIGKKTYKAHVKEKEEAKMEYDEAVSLGRTAGHVAHTVRDSNKFTVSVNVESNTKVIFRLTYEELLKRELSTYKHCINIDPGQLVPDLKVEVSIFESSAISILEVPPVRESNELEPESSTAADPFVDIKRPGPNKATVLWAPTVEEQEQLNKKGVKGQLIVRYDVDRLSKPEEVLINNGYFVHFFAPDNITPMRKHVIFVLDVSGSMSGRKIEQLIAAMNTILSDIGADDFFSVVIFSTNIFVWDSNGPNQLPDSWTTMGHWHEQQQPEQDLANTVVVPATPDNIQKAKDFINGLRSYSSTFIYEALTKAIEVVRLGKTLNAAAQQVPESLIIFLTDGQANGQISDTEHIVREITSKNSETNAAIFSLGFGNDADINFLKKLSLRNCGFARKIYEASDAALQLKNFYLQVASPLLSNVKFNYQDEKVDASSVTRTSFPTLFQGSEFVIVGRLLGDEFGGELTSHSRDGSLTRPIVEPTVLSKKKTTFMERMWAYLTIQQLLDSVTAASGEEANENKKKALELALKYSFVTTLTSLVVVKPDDKTTSADTERADEPVRSNVFGGYRRLVGGGPSGGMQAFAAPCGSMQAFGAPCSGTLFGGGSGAQFSALCMPSFLPTSSRRQQQQQSFGFGSPACPPASGLFGSSSFLPTSSRRQQQQQSFGFSSPACPPASGLFGSSNMTAGSTGFSFGSTQTFGFVPAPTGPPKLPSGPQVSSESSLASTTAAGSTGFSFGFTPTFGTVSASTVPPPISSALQVSPESSVASTTVAGSTGFSFGFTPTFGTVSAPTVPPPISSALQVSPESSVASTTAAGSTGFSFGFTPTFGTVSAPTVPPPISSALQVSPESSTACKVSRRQTRGSKAVDTAESCKVSGRQTYSSKVVDPAESSATSKPDSDICDKDSLIASKANGLILSSLDFVSSVRYQHGATTITLKVTNPTDKLLKGEFQLTLPYNAIISSCIFEVANQTVVAEAFLKEETAKKLADLKDNAVLVSKEADEDDMRLTICLEKNVNMTLKIVYKHNLFHYNGYDFVIFTNIHHILERITSTTTIDDCGDIVNLKAVFLNASDVISPNIEHVSASKAIISWTADKEKQLELKRLECGKLNITFDIDTKTTDYILTPGGYPIHQSDIPAMKDAAWIFVLDPVYKDLVLLVLKKLLIGRITIIIPQEENVVFTSSDREDVKRFLLKLPALDDVEENYIEDALLEALEISFETPPSKKVIIITMVGEKMDPGIVNQVTLANKEKRAAIFSLVYHKMKNIEHTKKLAFDNSGFARILYPECTLMSQVISFITSIQLYILNPAPFKYIEEPDLDDFRRKMYVNYETDERIETGLSLEESIVCAGVSLLALQKRSA